MPYTKDQLAELYLPKEAKQALKNGGHWERQPESAEECIPFVLFDEGEPMLLYYGFGHTIQKGQIMLQVWECDTDGNWEVQDEAEIGTPKAEELEKENSYEASLPGWINYYDHVIATGHDPLNEFHVSGRTKKVERQWQVLVSQSLLGVTFLGARRNARGPLLAADKLPEDVRNYLLLKRHETNTSVWLMELDWKQLQSLLKADKGVTIQKTNTPTAIKFLCKIEETIEAPTATYQRTLRKLARRAKRDDSKRLAESAK